MDAAAGDEKKGSSMISSKAWHVGVVNDARRIMAWGYAQSHWNAGLRREALTVLRDAGWGDDVAGFCAGQGLSEAAAADLIAEVTGR